MSASHKPKWVGFDDLLFRIGGAPMVEIVGDGEAALHAAKHVMFLFLKHGAWLARTTSPKSFEFMHGEHHVPLGEGDTIEPAFWQYFEDADAANVPYEALARGGPWAHWQYDKDGFEFGLPDDQHGAIVGRAHGVEVWVRTGKFSKPGRGERGPGRADSYGYAGAADRVKASVDAVEGEEAKRRARREGITRELDNGVGEGTRDNRKRHLERRLIKIGCRANASRKKHRKIV